MATSIRRPDPGGDEEGPHVPDGGLAGFLPRMWPGENCDDVIQLDPHPRASALLQFCPKRDEQRFDVVPVEVGTRGVGEDALKGPFMGLVHLYAFPGILDLSRQTGRGLLSYQSKTRDPVADASGRIDPRYHKQIPRSVQPNWALRRLARTTPARRPRPRARGPGMTRPRSGAGYPGRHDSRRPGARIMDRAGRESESGARLGATAAGLTDWAAGRPRLPRWPANDRIGPAEPSGPGEHRPGRSGRTGPERGDTASGPRRCFRLPAANHRRR